MSKESNKTMRSLRRSLHFVPAGKEKMFAKALELPADSLIIDLEDSVAAPHKERARAQAVEWLNGADFGGREKLVRINPQDSRWGREDIEAVLAARPDGLVLPKVASRGTVDAVDQVVGALEAEHGLESGSVALLLLGAETPRSLFRLPELVANQRVDALTWGIEDLAGNLGARRLRHEDGEFLPVFSHARSLCLLAAAAGGIQAVDTVFADFHDEAGLRKECLSAVEMGFTGKLTIHPEQIEVVNAVFTPTAEALSEARELVAAFEENEAGGSSAFSFDGMMVDTPRLKRARELLALAARISGQTG